MITIAVTSKDIANICGVSQGTVDRALNNRPGISPKTREKILQTAKDLGYRPHLLARSLVKGSTLTLGVVVFDLYNRFFAQLVNGIELCSREHGYFTYLTLTGKSKEAEKSCVEHLISRQVDGLVLCSVYQGDEYSKYLKQLKIPIITVGNRISGHFTFAGIDDYNAMKEAAACLINKGYSRIVYVSPPLSYRGSQNIYAQEQRLKGYLDALQESGKKFEPLVIDCKDYLYKLESLGIVEWEGTAVLCSNDIYMLEVMKYLESKSINVPESIGVMGFDNIDMLKYIHPRPATVAYPLEELGVKTVECLLSQVRDGNLNSDDIILSHRIVEGESIIK